VTTADGKPFAPFKTVILAGGFGTRLAERTDEMPKPMVEVGGRPMLWHILKIYSHFGFNDFLIATGYRSDVIKRFFLEYRDHASDLMIDYVNNRLDRLTEPVEPWRVALIHTGDETATGGRLRRLTAHLNNERFFMTYGDGVANIDLRALLEFHEQHGRLATFAAVHHPSPFGHPRLEGDRATSFCEKPDPGGQWISGGFFVLEPDVLSYIDGDATSFENDSLPRLAADDQLMAYRHEGFWHPMDTLRDVRNLNQMWNQPAAPWKVWTE